MHLFGYVFVCAFLGDVYEVTSRFREQGCEVYINQWTVIVVQPIPFSLVEAPVERMQMRGLPCRPRLFIPVCGHWRRQSHLGQSMCAATQKWGRSVCRPPVIRSNPWHTDPRDDFLWGPRDALSHRE